MIHLYVYGLVRDEGSVVLFAGEDDHRRPHMFAVDHRPAQDIVIALEEGEPVEVDIESWQVVGTPGPAKKEVSNENQDPA